MKSGITVFLCIGCLGLLLVLCAGCVSPPGTATREFHGTYNVTPGTTLEVDNQNGAVEVEAGTEPIARVNATLSTVYGTSELDRVQIRVTTDSTLRVETLHPVPPARVSVNYQIVIPREVNITTIQSSNGGISVRDASGTTSLITSNGPITVETFHGDIDARSSNGAVRIVDVDGVVSVSTSNAEILLQNVTAITHAETSNGRIIADVLSTERNVSLRTSNARVIIQLAPGLNADLSLSTSNGQILLTNVPVTVRQSSNSDLRGTIGSGGNSITVITSNSDIEVRMLTV